jgi:hypothetical protein
MTQMYVGLKETLLMISKKPWDEIDRLIRTGGLAILNDVFNLKPRKFATWVRKVKRAAEQIEEEEDA